VSFIAKPIGQERLAVFLAELKNVLTETEEANPDLVLEAVFSYFRNSAAPLLRIWFYCVKTSHRADAPYVALSGKCVVLLRKFQQHPLY